MANINDAISKLQEYKQEKVIALMQKLSKEEQESLSEQILNIDLGEIFEIQKNAKNEKWQEAKIEPIGFIDKNKLSDEEKKSLKEIGEKAIKSGEYAVVTMAGGQGTRLGCKGPKGIFKLDVGENGKYIFEILVDTLKRAKNELGIEVNWYIMTSTENNQQTIDFFEEHNFFGYSKEKVKFFSQGNLPLIDKEGNLLIKKEENQGRIDYKIKMASDGNGSIFKSLKRSEMLDDMKQKGIKWVYVCGVDNIMAKMVDILFLGLTIKENVETASKSVKKARPEEKVGVFCKKNGKPAIQEYIEMTEEMINMKDSSGELLYGDSNIISHLFNIDSIERLASKNLKYHCAEKKNSYIDENLQEVVPESPNSYKFECFIFDGFEYLDNMKIFRVERDEEFAPIKNATGVDSPETAKKIYERYVN